MLAVPAWDCLLTKQERIDLERVLKTGLRIISGKKYSTFDQVLKEGKLKTLQQVRTQIVEKFVRKSMKHENFSNRLVRQETQRMKTRAGQREKFKPVTARNAF